MADDVATGDKALFAFFEMLALAFAFEGTAAWLHNENADRIVKAYIACVILFCAGILVPWLRRRFASDWRLGRPLSTVLLTVGVIAAFMSVYYAFTNNHPNFELLIILFLIVVVTALGDMVYRQRSTPQAQAETTDKTLRPEDALVVRLSPSTRFVYPYTYYSLEVHNKSDRTIDGVEIRLCGVEPRPRAEYFGADFPYRVRGGTDHIDPSNTELYDILWFWTATTGETMIDGLDTKREFRYAALPIQEGECWHLEYSVSSRDSKPQMLCFSVRKVDGRAFMSGLCASGTKARSSDSSTRESAPAPHKRPARLIIQSATFCLDDGSGAEDVTLIVQSLVRNNALDIAIAYNTFPEPMPGSRTLQQSIVSSQRRYLLKSVYTYGDVTDQVVVRYVNQRMILPEVL